MKTVINTFVSLSLIACGSVDSTVTASSTAAAQNDALNVSETKLTDARKKALVNAYLLLDNAEITATAAEHFSQAEQFAVVYVSEVLPNVRLARPIAIVVPAGTVSAPSNPNRTDSFFVQFESPNAEELPKVYGPFQLTAQEGEACGRLAGLNCARGLQCATNAGDENANAAGGTCVAESEPTSEQ